MAEAKRKLSPIEWVILVECFAGVILALVLTINHTGVYLWSEHATEVLVESWNTTATIGLIVALVVAALVATFVWFLAKTTLGTDPVEDA